ncbi:MAG: hypothetical protein NTX33_06735 [Propionibacteriales bacterium]|nr:hypothetical protein [Propionibacteriales bacterium]
MKTPGRCALALITVALPLLAACSGADEPEKNEAVAPGPCAAPSVKGAFSPAAKRRTYDAGAFAVEYELSDGTKDCRVVEKAAVTGQYATAGKDTQINLRFGDVDLGLTVDVGSFPARGDKALALGDLHAGIGVQIDKAHFADPAGQTCSVTLADLTKSSYAGTFDCTAVEGLSEFTGPFGGEKTSLRLISASGWWRAES